MRDFRFARNLGLSQCGRTSSAAILAVLAAVALVSSAPAGTADGWKQLRRPLHLSRLAHGVACPVSRVDTRVAWKQVHIFGRSGTGRGPVYPGLGSQNGQLHATRDEQYGDRWSGEKVFWYVVPSYRGPVLIRGRRLVGPQTIGFNGTKRPDHELRISPFETVAWTGQPEEAAVSRRMSVFSLLAATASRSTGRASAESSWSLWTSHTREATGWSAAPVSSRHSERRTSQDREIER